MQLITKILDETPIKTLAKIISNWNRDRLAEFLFELSENVIENGIAINATGNLDDGQQWMSIGTAIGIASSELKLFISNKLKKSAESAPTE